MYKCNYVQIGLDLCNDSNLASETGVHWKYWRLNCNLYWMVPIFMCLHRIQTRSDPMKVMKISIFTHLHRIWRSGSLKVWRSKPSLESANPHAPSQDVNKELYDEGNECYNPHSPLSELKERRNEPSCTFIDLLDFSISCNKPSPTLRFIK